MPTAMKNGRPVGAPTIFKKVFQILLDSKPKDKKGAGRPMVAPTGGVVGSLFGIGLTGVSVVRGL